MRSPFIKRHVFAIVCLVSLPWRRLPRAPSWAESPMLRGLVCRV